MEYYLAIKKRNLAICDNMDGSREFMFCEISQAKKDKYHIISFVEYKKIKQNDQNSSRLVDREVTSGCHGEGVRVDGWEEMGIYSYNNSQS